MTRGDMARSVRLSKRDVLYCRTKSGCTLPACPCGSACQVEVVSQTRAETHSFLRELKYIFLRNVVLMYVALGIMRRGCNTVSGGEKKKRCGLEHHPLCGKQGSVLLPDVNNARTAMTGRCDVYVCVAHPTLIAIAWIGSLDGHRKDQLAESLKLKTSCIRL